MVGVSTRVVIGTLMEGRGETVVIGATGVRVVITGSAGMAAAAVAMEGVTGIVVVSGGVIRIGVSGLQSVALRAMLKDIVVRVRGVGVTVTGAMRAVTRGVATVTGWTRAVRVTVAMATGWRRVALRTAIGWTLIASGQTLVAVGNLTA